MNFAQRLKAAVRIMFASPNTWRYVPNTRVNYAARVGDGLQSNVVMAVLLWIMRTFPEAPIGVQKEGEIDHNHEMARLVHRPNKYFSNIELFNTLQTKSNSYKLYDDLEIVKLLPRIPFNINPYIPIQYTRIKINWTKSVASEY